VAGGPDRQAFIDSFTAEREAKPVAFVGYGLGMAGAVRAVEHLRQVFAESHCIEVIEVKDTVSFPSVPEHYDAQGRFPADAEAAAAAAKVMFEQLVRWGRVLRDAKRLRPYGA
jgi:NAD(P)H-dependent FMN reductase